MTDELNLEIVGHSPDKYVAACGITDYMRRCRDGEEEWSIDGVCASSIGCSARGGSWRSASRCRHAPPL